MAAMNADKLKKKLKSKVSDSQFHYRQGKTFISLEKAQTLGWAKLSDGSPTADYLKILDARERRKKKGKKPRKPRKSASLGFVYGKHAGIESPFNLERRSGYKTIWQVLAESVDKIVPWDKLQKEVNKRLSEEDASKDWYKEKYVDEGKTYDTRYNAGKVLTRHPYCSKLEALNQRVYANDKGARLATNVTTKRENSRLNNQKKS